MAFLETLRAVTFIYWVVISIRTVIALLKISRPAWKQDLGWFSMKGSYWKGFAIGMIWALIFSFMQFLSPRLGLLTGIAIQWLVAVMAIWKRKPSPIERDVWLSVPLFVWPLWLPILQGQKAGELPAPNP